MAITVAGEVRTKFGQSLDNRLSNIWLRAVNSPCQIITITWSFNIQWTTITSCGHMVWAQENHSSCNYVSLVKVMSYQFFLGTTSKYDKNTLSLRFKDRAPYPLSLSTFTVGFSVDLSSLDSDILL